MIKFGRNGYFKQIILHIYSYYPTIGFRRRALYLTITFLKLPSDESN